MPPPAEPGPRAGLDWREAALGGVAVALAIAVALEARRFEGGSAYDVLGPRLMPFLIAIGLALSGGSILAGALRGRRAPSTDGLAATPVLLIAAALATPIALIRPLGWIPCAALTFALGARAFASRTPLLDLALGLGFGVVSFALFNYGLGLNLPSGDLPARLLGL